MALTMITPPAAEPISLAEAKAQVRFDSNDEDTLINRLISAARRRIERDEWRAHITQTWKLTLDRFPPLSARRDSTIYVPRPPLQSVTSITYLDLDGNTQTLSSSLYRVDTTEQPGRITPAWGESWPGTRDVSGAVTVTYVAGYGDAASDVPEETRQAIAIAMSAMWRREHELPTVVGALLNTCHDPRVLEFV